MPDEAAKDDGMATAHRAAPKARDNSCFIK